MNEFITIGQIVRGVGIRGELKVKPLTDDVNRYKKLKVVYVKSTPYRMLSCRFVALSKFLQWLIVTFVRKARSFPVIIFISLSISLRNIV